MRENAIMGIKKEAGRGKIDWNKIVENERKKKKRNEKLKQ